MSQSARVKQGVAVEEPRCPFCTEILPRPRELEPRRLGDFEYGVCKCGAVFVHDVTGHNLGAAMVEALGFACDDDWDMAWDLAPEDDYLDALIERYDSRSHMIYPLGHDFEGNPVRGALSFIRLQDDIRDVKGDAPKRKFESSAVRRPEGPRPLATGGDTRADGPRKRFSKRAVKSAVERQDLEELISMAKRDRLVMRKIQRLLYSADENMRWKAVVMLGGVGGALAQDDPVAVGDLLRRMLYAANDSAATNWGSIEVIGELIRHQPSLYGSFVRHILGLLYDIPSRPAILWAIGRIGGLHPEVVKKSSFFALFDLLKSDDPAVRGHAVWALGQIGASEAENTIRRMVEDGEEFQLFDGEDISYTSVGREAKRALLRFEKEREGKKMSEEKNRGPGGQKDQEPEDLREARRLYQEAELFKNRGQSLDAIERYEAILPVFEAHGYEVEVANICEKLGDIHIMRGNVKSALAPYQRTLAICEKKNDPISTVIMIEKVIDVYRHLEEWDKALPYFFRGLELVEELSDVKRAALFLAGIGDIYHRQGELEKALDSYQVAEKLLRNMGAQENADKVLRGIEKLKAEMEAGGTAG